MHLTQRFRRDFSRRMKRRGRLAAVDDLQVASGDNTEAIDGIFDFYTIGGYR